MVSSTAIPERLSSVQDYKAFLDKFDTFLLDCDGTFRMIRPDLLGLSRSVAPLTISISIGVLWHGNHVLSGILDTISFLRRNSKYDVLRSTLHGFGALCIITHFLDLSISLGPSHS